MIIFVLFCPLRDAVSLEGRLCEDTVILVIFSLVPVFIIAYFSSQVAWVMYVVVIIPIAGLRALAHDNVSRNFSRVYPC